MQTSQATVISSMSAEWLASVRQSGRFGVHDWKQRVTVRVTTMDALIAEYGQPAFCKLDVEGFESEVLAGLSSAVPALSFECTPEFLTNTISCVDRLNELGHYEYNYNLSETMRFELADWVSPGQIQQLLRTIDSNTFADVYARIRAI